jgi:tetratricopeptide (TPR) repeat protein
MSYPGNASIAPDIQTRILDTFQQTLALVESNSLKEAKLGCDFILRLDPMFEPARWLQDRLESVDGEIHLDDLREAVAAAEPQAEAAADEAAAPASAAGDLIPDPIETAPATPAGAGDLVPDPIETAPATPAGGGDLIPDPIESAPATPAGAGDLVPDSIETAPVAPAGGGELIPDPIEGAAAEPSPAPVPIESLPAEPAEDETPLEAEAAAEPPEEPAQTQAAAFSDAEEPVPATAEEVMDSPVAALDTESEKRVRDLLAEGEAALERGEYQTAIDSWSRIFLIDIDHPEANARIEDARKLKDEAERSVEEAFHEALGMVDRGEIDQARAGLERVLEMQPDHLTAREQLERLDSPAAVEAAVAAAAAPPTAEPAGDDAPTEGPALDEPGLEAPELDLDLDALSTADDLDLGPPAAVPLPKPKRKAPPAQSGDRKRILLYVGAAIVLVVLAGGWLLTSNWSKMFPNGTEPAADAGDRPDAIERAEALHAQGKTGTALAQLKRLPPHDELYSEAQALIAQWEALEAAAAVVEEPAEADLAEFESLMQQASAAQARKEFLRVEELLERAAAIQPLDEQGIELQETAQAELEPLRSQMAIFRQGEWEVALRDLWMLRDRMPDSPDLNRLMVDSYYNLGVRALQRGDTGKAASHFKEALQLTAGDSELQRASRFANTYQNRPEDLLYRIFVKYLPFR